MRDLTSSAEVYVQEDKPAGGGWRGPVVGVISCLALLAVSSTQAKDRVTYPDRPVKLVIPSPPGSPPDLIGRLLGAELTRMLGQPIVFDNRPGATGIVGLQVLAKSAPDGYTLGVVAMPFVVMTALVADMPYDTEKDLAPVALVCWHYSMLAVRADSPWQSLAQIIEAARARPGALKFSSSGPATPPELAGALFKREAKIDIVEVPYKGAPASVLGLLAGDVDLTISSVGALSAHIASGKVRALATTAPHRLVAYPNLPTFAELGFETVQIQDWLGIAAPAGTPKQVIDYLYGEIKKATAAPALKARLDLLGMEAATLAPDQFTEHIHNEIQRGRELVRATGLKTD